MRIEVEETIAAPPERVWAAVADPDSLGKWMSGLVRIERLGGPPFGKGTRFREVRKMFGKEAAEVFEVVSVDPPRSFELHVDGKQGSSGCGEYRFRHELVPVAGGTRLRMTGEIGGGGWFQRLVGALFKGFFRKAIAKDLRSLKAYVEGGAPATS
jgi:carbon monoxide dehydrogenase subunit G